LALLMVEKKVLQWVALKVELLGYELVVPLVSRLAASKAESLVVY